MDAMRKEMLADAIAEEKRPKVCIKHPLACWYDAPECPACIAEREFLKLTDEMAVRLAATGDL